MDELYRVRKKGYTHFASGALIAIKKQDDVVDCHVSVGTRNSQKTEISIDGSYYSMTKAQASLLVRSLYEAKLFCESFSFCAIEDAEPKEDGLISSVQPRKTTKVVGMKEYNLYASEIFLDEDSLAEPYTVSVGALVNNRIELKVGRNAIEISPSQAVTLVGHILVASGI